MDALWPHCPWDGAGSRCALYPLLALYRHCFQISEVEVEEKLAPLVMQQLDIWVMTNCVFVYNAGFYCCCSVIGLHRQMKALWLDNRASIQPTLALTHYFIRDECIETQRRQWWLLFLFYFVLFIFLQTGGHRHNRQQGTGVPCSVSTLHPITAGGRDGCL